MFMPRNERLQYLFYRYFNREHTSNEKEELLELIAGQEHDEEIKELVEENWDKEFPEVQTTFRKIGRDI